MRDGPLFMSPITLGSVALWRDCFTLFLSIVVQALPFLVLGVGLSGILAVFVDERQIIRFLPKQRWASSVVGGTLGFLFPVCECGNLPVARQLVTKGVPPHVAIAFLLAAPVFNPVVIVATWIAFRQLPELVFWRISFSLGMAVVVGWIFSFQRDLTPLLQPAIQQSLSRPSLLQGGTFWIPATPSDPLTVISAEQVYQGALDNPPIRFIQKMGQLVDTWVRELRELGAVLILGAATAALIQTLIPRSVLLQFGQDPLSSILVMIGLATIVSICSTVDAFFALAFVTTFTPASLLAFLVFGPVIDLKAIGLMLTLFKPRAILYIIVLTLQFTLIGSLVLNRVS